MSDRVLLLVPPARDVVIRDYYCSKTSQANYLHPPIDLAVQGGWIRRHGMQPVLVDATVSQERDHHRVLGVFDQRVGDLLSGRKQELVLPQREPLTPEKIPVAASFPATVVFPVRAASGGHFGSVRLSLAVRD